MTIRILHGDCRSILPTLADASVQCCVTSPPYFGLRDYGVAGQIGLEPTPDEYVAALVETFRGVRRVLRDDGTLWLNLGDSYASNWPCNRRSIMGAGSLPNGKRENRQPQMGPGLKDKDLLMIPARVALALQADGWWLRSMLPWVKRSVMPESVSDRPSSAIEYVFMLAKRASYFWDAEAVKRTSEYQPGGSHAARAKGYFRGKNAEDPAREAAFRAIVPTRNFRNSDLFFDSLTEPHGLITDADGEPLAIDVNPQPLSLAHFATFPPRLIEPFIRAGTSERGACPGCGAPWVRVVERTTEPDPTYRGSRFDVGKTAQRDGADRTQPGQRFLLQSTGWRQSCACPPAPPSPCVVLDPFFGAGTTGLVADRLGRDCIGIELSPAYTTMAGTRVTNDAGLFAEVAHV